MNLSIYNLVSLYDDRIRKITAPNYIGYNDFHTEWQNSEYFRKLSGTFKLNAERRVKFIELLRAKFSFTVQDLV